MQNIKEKFNTMKLLFAIFLVFVLIIGVLIGYSSAYFTADVINTAVPKSTVITTGTMKIEFSDGPEVSINNTIPGQSVTKTFTVKNIGTLDTYYDVYLSDLINNFEDKSDLVYTLTSTNGGANALETDVPSVSSKIVNNKLLAVDAIHTYSLIITFKETNDNQNDNLNKKFSSIIRVNDVKEAPSSIIPKSLKVGDKVIYSASGNQGEINNWIVIKEGIEPELVSETTSPNTFSIDNENDWLNWVGILNEQAASYGTNSDVVKSTRHMGYSDQVEYCSDFESCTTDTGYTIDTGTNDSGSDDGLVYKAMKTLNARTPGSEENVKYWLASRYLHKWDNPEQPDNYITRWVSDGQVSTVSSSLSDSCTIRPIITLISTIKLEKISNTEYKVMV